MARVEAVLFDLDGTLLDTLADIANSANDVLARMLKAPVPIDDYRILVGDGVSTLFHRLLPQSRQDAGLHEACLNAFDEIYAQRCFEHSRPYEGIADLLTWLSAHHIPMAILSNKPDLFTNRLARELLGNWEFAVVLGASDRFPKKPDPASTHYICSTMKVFPSRMFYLGDTNTDMQTAKRAGCIALGATWGFRTKAELINAGADAIIDEPMQVTRLFHL